MLLMYLFIATVFYKESQVPQQESLHAQTSHDIQSLWNTWSSDCTLLFPASASTNVCIKKSFHPHSYTWIFKYILKPNSPNKITSNKPSLNPLTEVKGFLLLFTPVTLHFSWKQNMYSCLLRWIPILLMGALQQFVSVQNCDKTPFGQEK